MDQALLDIIVLMVDVVLIGLAAAMLYDRVRLGVKKADRIAMDETRWMVARENEAAHMDRIINEQQEELDKVELERDNARAELAKLQQHYEVTDVPFKYTPTSVAGFDMYATCFQFNVRPPGGGDDAWDVDEMWIPLRRYLIGAGNQAEARSLLARMLPRAPKFVIDTVGAVSGTQVHMITGHPDGMEAKDREAEKEAVFRD